jgi:hypothetical protein
MKTEEKRQARLASLMDGAMWAAECSKGLVKLPRGMTRKEQAESACWWVENAIRVANESMATPAGGSCSLWAAPLAGSPLTIGGVK